MVIGDYFFNYTYYMLYIIALILFIVLVACICVLSNLENRVYNIYIQMYYMGKISLENNYFLYKKGN